MTAAVPEPTLEGQIAGWVAEHRLNTVTEGDLAWRRTRVKCDGETCDFYAERPRYWDAVAEHDAHLAAVLAPLVVEVRERAVKAWNIEVARLAKVRALVEVMERDYSHAEAGHVRMAAGRLLNALDTPVEELRASLPFSAAGGRP